MRIKSIKIKNFRGYQSEVELQIGNLTVLIGRNDVGKSAEKRPDLKGFSRPGLYRMRQFYELYKDDAFVSPLVRQIDWTHHLVIMARAKTPEERRFYINKCATEHCPKRNADENPSVGVILCTDKDDTVVEYALSCSMSPAMVASYQTALPDKTLLQNRLRQITDIALEEVDAIEPPRRKKRRIRK